MKSSVAGIMAGFEKQEDVVRAAEEMRRAGYRNVDAYSPFPVQGLAEALGHRRSAIPLLVLAGGISAGLGGYFMEWYAATIDYPVNIGGRPLHSWPAFIPITFELTILGAALTAIISMLALNRLPRPYHPVFNVPDFARASTDRFFICIEASDPKFDLVTTRAHLETLHPYMIEEVPA